MVIPDIIQLDEVTVAAARTLYEFSFPPEGGFIISRKNNDAIIFNTAEGSIHRSLIFEKNYIQICSTTNRSPKFYGWGERRTRFLLPYPFNFTFNNNDKATPADGSNLYGSHPFHIEISPSGEAHGVLFFNSAPVQTELEDWFVTYRSMDGILDFYFFLGPTMKDVMNQYTGVSFILFFIIISELIGRPFLVPHWATGFHQCHFGTYFR
jgi:alpha-glucosidase (family GH31 glycosyl hydrolase)